MNKNYSIIRILLCIFPILISGCSIVGGDDNDDDDNRKNSGLPARPNNTSCIAPPTGPVSSTDVSLTSAFPNLPPLGAVVALTQVPGDNSQIYAVIKDGRVLRFDNNPSVSTTTEFMDISATSQVEDSGEQGLLGMAFHPDYANNGELYLYYSTLTPNRRSNISRFVNIDNVWQEEIVLSVAQPYSNHNGGNIMFGPADGYLYIGLGDGGSGNDPDGNGQDRRTLLGSMLRLDVDNGTPYAIPADNPYFGNPLCSNVNIVENAQFCPEIYAYGLRNPWRWSFDRLDHSLWLGDVGQGAVEEVDIIENGGNYGWLPMEGSRCTFGGNACNPNGEFILPVAEYLHNGQSRSIVGGYVYRGNDPAMAGFYGRYFFGDTISGEIWTTRHDGNDYVTELLMDTDFTIYSFAETLDGNVFILNLSFSVNGTSIYQFTASDVIVTPSPVAQSLEDTGCFEGINPPVPAEGVIPYDVNSPLWSDGAEKERYFAIPDGTRINVTPNGDFIFPVGSVLIKHFLLNEQYVETRFLMHHENGWAGYSYEWVYDTNGDLLEVSLLADQKTKNIGAQNWFYPAPDQCVECHTNVANISLGLESLQLNRNFTYNTTNKTANQLDTLDFIGLFNQPLRNEHYANKLRSLEDDSASLLDRVKSYLHSNCAHCHQNNGPTPVDMDLHFLTALPDMNVCDVDPSEGDLGVAGIKRIDPAGTFDQPNSMIVTRIETADTDFRMPPLATEVNDDLALAVIKSWIEELNTCD